MKKILMLATGGTISCRQTEEGLAPVLDGNALLEFIPGIPEHCEITVENPMRIDSTDVTAKDQMKLSGLIRKNYERFDGFIISHGTDTLSYTAALMYHVIRNPDKPVIITGSMKPIGEPGSDAEKNLIDSFKVAVSGCKGVAAVLNGKIIKGNHVVKIHSQSIDAFRSIGAPYEGFIDGSGKVRFSSVPYTGKGPSFIDKIDTNVVLIKLTPDIDIAIIEFLNRYKKVIIEGFGSSGIPKRLENPVRELICGGTKVYLTHQCVGGGIDLSIYESGRRTEDIGVVSLGSRTIEDALASIMCEEI